jgi:hypothetical protein
MTHRVEQPSDKRANEERVEPAVEELRKKAEVLQRIADNQREQKAKEELEKGRPLERVFDIYFDRG